MSMQESKESPIFIVACPRSGTTILASILNSHSLIATATETHFFNYITKQKKYNWKNFDQKQFAMILEESRIVDFFTLSKISKEELMAKFDITKFSHDINENKKTVFNFLITALAEKKQKQLFCEKTPQHLLNLDEILELYPNAKIIHIVRDGRDVVNSLLKMPWRPDGLLNNSRFWKFYIRLGKKYEKKLEKHKFKTIRFEDLLGNPEATIKGVCDFLEIHYEETMLVRSGQNRKDFENIFSDWESSWKHKSVEEIDSTRVGAWKKELSAEDQLILNWHQRKLLLDLGYEAESIAMNFDTRIKVFLKYLDLFIKKFFRVLSFAIN